MRTFRVGDLLHSRPGGSLLRHLPQESDPNAAYGAVEDDELLVVVELGPKLRSVVDAFNNKFIRVLTASGNIGWVRSENMVLVSQ